MGVVSCLCIDFWLRPLLLLSYIILLWSSWLIAWSLFYCRNSEDIKATYREVQDPSIYGWGRDVAVRHQYVQTCPTGTPDIFIWGTGTGTCPLFCGNLKQRSRILGPLLSFAPYSPLALCCSIEITWHLPLLSLIYFVYGLSISWCTRWHGWCREVAVSIPDGVIGIFQWLNHSVSVRNKYHGYLLGGKWGRRVGLTTCCVEILGALTS